MSSGKTTARTDKVDSELQEYLHKLRSLVSAWSINPSNIAAWKLGGSTFSSRSELQSLTSLFGPLLESQVTTDYTNAPVGSAQCLEVEIAMRFTNESGFEWCWAIDLPSKVEFLPGQTRWPALVEAYCGAGHLLLIDKSSKSGAFNLPSEASIQIGSQNYELDFSRMINPPLETFEEFHAVARDVGIPALVGQWVALGGLTPCILVEGGEMFTIREDGQIVATISLVGGAHPA